MTLPAAAATISYVPSLLTLRCDAMMSPHARNSSCRCPVFCSVASCAVWVCQMQSLAPPGCETFYVLSPVPNLDAGVDWITMAETYRARIAAALEATVLPGLSERLRTSRMTTPLDFRDRLDSYRGAGFSLEPILFQSAWFRPNNRSEEVEGLYLVGAGTHPGAGLPGVLSTAKVLEHLIPHAPRAA